LKYKRVLLKLSGEALSGVGETRISIPAIENIVKEIKKAVANKVELAIVIGGGNIWRGAGKNIDRVKADYMGMLATIINSLAIQDILEKNGIKAYVLSAIGVPKIAELYGRK